MFPAMTRKAYVFLARTPTPGVEKASSSVVSQWRETWQPQWSLVPTSKLTARKAEASSGEGKV